MFCFSMSIIIPLFFCRGFVHFAGKYSEKGSYVEVRLPVTLQKSHLTTMMWIRSKFLNGSIMTLAVRCFTENAFYRLRK